MTIACESGIFLLLVIVQVVTFDFQTLVANTLKSILK